MNNNLRIYILIITIYNYYILYLDNIYNNIPVAIPPMKAPVPLPMPRTKAEGLIIEPR